MYKTYDFTRDEALSANSFLHFTLSPYLYRDKELSNVHRVIESCLMHLPNINISKIG